MPKEMRPPEVDSLENIPTKYLGDGLYMRQFLTWHSELLALKGGFEEESDGAEAFID